MICFQCDRELSETEESFAKDGVCIECQEKNAKWDKETNYEEN